MKFAQFAIACSAGLLTVAATNALEAAIVPTYVSSTGGFTGSTANDNGETTGQTAPAGATVVYQLGANAVTFNDISITSSNVIGRYTPNNFNIQVLDNDNLLTGTWVPLVTASNIFGYASLTSSVQYDAGRRLEFTPVTKKYIRYVNTDTTTDYFPEIQIGRQVILTSASGAPSSTARIMNEATDSKSADPSTFRMTGTSGSLVFDALVPQGEGVSAITLQHSDTTAQIASTSFPMGSINVYYSNNPASFTNPPLTFTLNSDETASSLYTLNFANPVNARYFKVDWPNTVNSGATYTQFAEIGINTAALPVPEPTALSLLGVAGLLLIRRKRR